MSIQHFAILKTPLNSTTRLLQNTSTKFLHPTSRRPITTSPPSHNTPSRPPHSTNKPSQPDALPSLNLFHLLRDAKPSVRYTVYLGLALMATVESTFWFNVIKAKYFPSVDQDEQQKSDDFLDVVRGAIDGYRAQYLGNYRRYYGGYVWGVGER